MHSRHTLVAFTDTIKLDLERNTDLLEYISTSDAGALENTRGAECACRDDYELLGANGMHVGVGVREELFVPCELNTGRLVTTV